MTGTKKLIDELTPDERLRRAKLAAEALRASGRAQKIKGITVMTSPIETNNVVQRLPDKIKSRVKVCDDGCWRWQGWIDPQGYGYCYYEGKRHSTHRLSYQILVGPIPSDLVCDHLCCVRNCLNPSHIELVTSGIKPTHFAELTGPNGEIRNDWARPGDTILTAGEISDEPITWGESSSSGNAA